MVSLESIETAATRIGPSIYESPLVHSKTLSRLTGNSIFLKLENLQMTGSFKERGALNRILTMTDADRRKGVIAASAGNHGQGVAYHATQTIFRSKSGCRGPLPSSNSRQRVGTGPTWCYTETIMMTHARPPWSRAVSERRHSSIPLMTRR